MRELSGSDIFESSLPVEGRAIRRITVPVMDAIANVVLGIPIMMILRWTSLDAQQTQTFASTRMVAQ